ncbi:MAG: hypothetical protein CVU87_06435 [Firmicutes bacterium HGW-Firmicutes-12]|jgi:hypothetical protein|nr:MAG: hypothetical protein CVU87_06435 [Firmicutes bacterium HGW-Firmicutes-12]
MFTSYGLKKVTLVLFLIIFLSILLGCGIDEEKKEIYDNETSIVQEGDTFSFYKRIGKADEKQVNIKYSRFFGVQTLWAIQVEEKSEIELNYKSQVKSGDFKVVIVTPKQELLNIAEQNSTGSVIVAASKGKYSIKIVGKNANGNIQINLSRHVGYKVVMPREDNRNP